MVWTQDGETALIRACKNGNVDVVKILVDAETDVNAKDNVGARSDHSIHVCMHHGKT